MDIHTKKLINEALDEVLGKSNSGCDKEKIKETLEESDSTGLCPPPSIVKMMHEIGLATHNDNKVLLTAVLKELRDLRAVVDEMRKERECGSRK